GCVVEVDRADHRVWHALASEAPFARASVGEDFLGIELVAHAVPRGDLRIPGCELAWASPVKLPPMRPSALPRSDALVMTEQGAAIVLQRVQGELDGAED